MGVTEYDEAVLGDSPSDGYWLFENESGDTPDEGEGSVFDLVGVTYGVDGPMAGSKAVSFDGSSDYGVTEAGQGFDGDFNKTIECWVKWDAFANDDDLLFELSTNANGKFGLRVNPNSSDGSGAIAITLTLPGGVWEDALPRFSAGAWHHLVITFDRGTPAIRAWVDGVEADLEEISHANWEASNFEGAPFYLMSRAGSSLFGAGAISRLAIYPTLLTNGQIVAHYEAAEVSDPNPSLEEANDLTDLGGYNRINPRKLRGWK